MKASQLGLERVDRARRSQEWNKQSLGWCHAAHVSLATLKRFWRRLPIQREAFIAICQAIGVDWQDVVSADLLPPPPDEPESLVEAELWIERNTLMDGILQKLRGPCRLLVLAGMTGSGKSVLSTQIIQALHPSHPQAIVIYFDTVETTGFAQVASQLLGQPVDFQTTTTAAVVSQLVSQFVSQPLLLVLDGWEAVLQGDEETGWSTFQEPAWATFLQQFLAATTVQGRILATSQDQPAELELIGTRYPDRWHCQPVRGFTVAEQRRLFQQADLWADGQADLTRIGAAYEGHPLALRVIVGEILGQPFAGNVRAYWQTYQTEITNLEQAQQQTADTVQGAQDALRLDRYSRHLRRMVRSRIEETFQRLAVAIPQAYLLLCFAAVYRQAVPPEFWLKMLEPLNLELEQQYVLLDALRDRFLVEEVIEADQLYLRQHNLIRSVALAHLKQLGT